MARKNSQPQAQAQEMQNRPETVLFAGIERCDILELLTQTGMKEGKRVCVIDDSYSHDLFITKAPDENSMDTDRDNITYFQDTQYSPAMKEYYDFIFVYTGMRDDVKIDADYYIIQTDAAKQNLLRTRHIMEAMGINDYFLIYRDRESKKIKPSAMIDFLGVKPEETAVIDLNVEDFSAYVAFTNNSHMVEGLKNFSTGMQDTAVYLYEKLYHVDSKTMKRRYY